MKRIIATIAAIAVMGVGGLTAYAAENLDRDAIETAIWEDLWHGKGDNGYDYPEASYKHHILDQWLNENYGKGGLDWTETGEVKHEYRRYYRDLIEGWDFEDDHDGNWTIATEDNQYSFMMLNGNWQMIDQNGDTVDSFPPFSTLKEDEPESTSGYEIHDDGSDSPRVIGEVTGRTETASDGSSSAKGNDTTKTAASGSQDDPVPSGTNPLPIIAGVAALAGIGGAGYYISRKKK